MSIEWDLETTPIAVRTNSVPGSDDVVNVEFSARGEYAGGVRIHFSSTPQYYLLYCTSFKTVLVNLPSANDKVWRITLTRTAGVRLVIHCNLVEVVNILNPHSTFCDRASAWDSSTIWNRDVTTIRFNSDTASDYYGPQPGDY